MVNTEFCIHTTDAGTFMGKLSNWPEVNKIAKSGVPVSYLGNYMTWDDDTVYVVFRAEEVNYIVKLKN